MSMSFSYLSGQFSPKSIGKIEDKNNDNDNTHDDSNHRKCCPKHIPKLEKSCRDPCHTASKLIINRIENGEDTDEQNSDDQEHQNQQDHRIQQSTSNTLRQLPLLLIIIRERLEGFLGTPRLLSCSSHIDNIIRKALTLFHHLRDLQTIVHLLTHGLQDFFCLRILFILGKHMQSVSDRYSGVQQKRYLQTKRRQIIVG